MPSRNKEGFRRFFGYLEEVGLTEPLREICKAHCTSLMEIYLDTVGQSSLAARLEVWWWLKTEIGKSDAEIGRMFDRDASSVHYGQKKVRDVIREREWPPGEVVARTAARIVAARATNAKSANGARAATALNAPRKPGS